MFSILATLHGSLSVGVHVPFIPFFIYITHEVPAALCQLPVLFPDVLLNAWNQRITEWFELEGALKIIYHGQNCLLA